MVYIILGKGFEEIEAIAPGDILRRARIPMMYAGVGGRKVEGAHGIIIEADISVEELKLEELDMIVLPGGGEGVKAIEADPAAMAAVDYAVAQGKYVAAICAAPMILGKRGFLDGRNAVCYPGCEPNMGKAIIHPEAEYVVDGQFITGRCPGAAIEFGLKLVDMFKSEYTSDEICQYMVYEKRN